MLLGDTLPLAIYVTGNFCLGLSPWKTHKRCKMRDKFKKQRLRNVMPKYYDYSDYKGHSVRIVPTGLRRIPILREWLPYFIGDRVMFDVLFKALPEKQKQYTENPLSDYVLWELHPNGSQRDYHEMRDANNEQYTIRFTSNIITQQGDFTVYLGLNLTPDPRAPLFTAEIMHKDRRRYDVFLVLIGLAGSCIIGGLLWLLGFIQITPFWKIWVP
jgi:hypothetical protein